MSEEHQEIEDVLREFDKLPDEFFNNRYTGKANRSRIRCYVEDIIRTHLPKPGLEGLDVEKIIPLIDEWEDKEFGHYQCDCVPANPKQVRKLAEKICQRFGKPKAEYKAISQCPHCLCMTHNVCGKCELVKDE